MAKSLILVESQQKFYTIQTYLDETEIIYNINGAVEDGGMEYLQHLIFGAPPQLAFLTKEKINQLAQVIEKSDSVFLATSPDFTGDALAYQLSTSLGPLKSGMFRISLHLLSKKALRTSLNEKQTLRRTHGELLEQSLKIDSTFDYYVREQINIKRAKRPIFGLAAALALKKLCEQETADSNKSPWSHTSINVIFKQHQEKYSARLLQMNGQPPSITDKQIAKAIIFDLKEHKIKISHIADKSISTAPPLPLTTAKLIANAEKHLGYTARQTMTVARSLYNGCQVGLKHPVGLITYPISDSLFCPEEDLLAAREFILINYGKDYLPEKPRLYSEKKENIFSVIRPTMLSRTPKKMSAYVTNEQLRLYELIWSRFLASQMSDSSYIRRKVMLTAGPKKRYVFQLEQNQTTSRGYLQLFPQTANKTSFLFAKEFQREAELVAHDFEIVSEKFGADFYYTEGRLLEAIGDMDVCLTEMLELIPDILTEWKFIRRTDDGKWFPTPAGKNAYELLQHRYPDILNERFVRQFKKKFLQNINDEKKKKIDPAAELLKLLQHKVRPIQTGETSTAVFKKAGGKCPVCGGAMLQQNSDVGEFIICEHYPESCHYSKSNHGQTHRYFGRCEKCNAELTLKIGRFGRFLACSTFPKCKFTKPYPTGAKCPMEGCSGDVIERITKTGRLFYGCSFYPKCKFSSWQMPVNMACPRCGNLYMVSKNAEDYNAYSCPKCKTEFDHNLVAV